MDDRRYLLPIAIMLLTLLILAFSGCLEVEQAKEKPKPPDAWIELDCRTHKMIIPEGTIYRYWVGGVGGGVTMIFVPAQKEG